MSPLTARAVSMALLGGLTAPLFLAGGLLEWAAFIAWGGFLAAGGDSAALRKTIPGYVFGAFLAWVAMMLRNQVDVSTGMWLWMPRAGIAAGTTLLILGLATKVELLSYLPAGLIGFAAVFGAISIPLMGMTGYERLNGMHLYNPFIQVVVSLIGGAIVGLLSVKLAEALTKK